MKAVLAMCLSLSVRVPRRARPTIGRAWSSSSVLRVRPSTRDSSSGGPGCGRPPPRKAGAESILIGQRTEAGVTDRDRLHSVLVEQSKASRQPLWIVLIGHGTYDGREAKFNLRGADVTDLELAEWLSPVKRQVVVINCASASGPFINRLSGPNRVVVTATKSGFEMNFARFGQYLAEAIADPRADLDKDGQVSLLEAYLTAEQPGRRVLSSAFATGERACLAR